MMTTFNPLIRTANFVLSETKAYDSERDVSSMLTGGLDSAQAKKWPGSAVVLKNGEVEVIEMTGGVRAVGDSALQIKLFSGGTLAGHGKWHDAAWVKENVEAVYFGALWMPDGEGANARFADGDAVQSVRVQKPGGAPPTGGKWQVLRWRADGKKQKSELLEALGEVGAVKTLAASEPEAPLTATLPLCGEGNRALPLSMAAALAALGMRKACSFGGTLCVVELGNMLCATAVEFESAVSVVKMLGRTTAGARMRLTARNMLLEDWATLGEEGVARLRADGAEYLSGVDQEVRDKWPPGVSAAMAAGEVQAQAQARRAARSPPGPIRDEAEPSGRERRGGATSGETVGGAEGEGEARAPKKPRRAAPMALALAAPFVTPAAATGTAAARRRAEGSGDDSDSDSDEDLRRTMRRSRGARGTRIGRRWGRCGRLCRPRPRT